MGIFSTFLKLLFAPVIALCVIVVRPFYKIKFAKIDVSRLGYLAFEPDVGNRSKLTHKEQATYVYYYSGTVVNDQLLTLWSRQVLIINPIEYAHGLLKFLKLGNLFTVNTSIDSEVDYDAYFSKTPPPITFNDSEIRSALDQCKKMYITLKSEWVCFTNREAAQFFTADKDASANTVINDYRDFSINTMKDASCALNECGLLTIRMGAGDALALEWKHEGLIDYAHKFRNELMDLFLISKCKFYLGPNAGLYVVAKLFRKPVALINLSPFTGTNGYFSASDLFIPKKYINKKTKKYLNLSEIIKMGAHQFMTSKEFSESQIELQSNSAEEIAELSLEMNQRLSGLWKEEHDQQVHFQKHIKQLLNNQNIKIPKIGAEFLRKNEWLLN